jgi:heme/copper-type cytochrome/quinol oxidase subunit 4
VQSALHGKEQFNDARLETCHLDFRNRDANGVLIVTIVATGSLWIMSKLNDNMMPPAELMNLHMQH